MDAPRTNLLIISNSLIEALATNPTIRANFAQCFTAFTRGADCNKCGSNLRRGQADYDAVRDCLGGLPAAKLLLLKRLLNTNKVRLNVRRGTASRVQLTF